MRILRIYVDTSVIGGCFDEEFAAASIRVIEGVRRNEFVRMVTELVFSELNRAPEPVRAILATLTVSTVEQIELTAEVMALRDAYLAAGIVGPLSADDATHVAAATVARADAIVSWNFRHIVRLDKMKAYNQINLLHGYGILTIVSPKEVKPDDKESNEEIL